MQQHQIEIIRFEQPQRIFHRLARVVVGFEIHLGNEKQRAAVNAALFYAFAHFLFVAVSLCCVNETIAALDGSRNSVDAWLSSQHKGAKADQRHWDAVAQSQIFHPFVLRFRIAQTSALCYNHCNKFE